MSEASGRRAIVVAGMHRSGTSAFARCVNLLGAGIGERLIPTNWGNERGFWEDEEVVAANDALLAAAGRTWHDVRPMPLAWEALPAIAAPAARVARIVADETARCPLWVVKDPRLSRLVPAWDVAFAASAVEPHFLVVLRNPAEVAASQERRDGFPAGKSHLLWMRHLLEVERATRGRRRFFSLYDDILRDWRSTLSRAAEVLGLDWPVPLDEAAPGIEAFLGDDLRHFSIDEDRAWQVSAAPVVVEAWRALRSAAGSAGEDVVVHEALDRVREGIAAADGVFLPSFDELCRELQESRVAINSQDKGWREEIERGSALEAWGRELEARGRELAHEIDAVREALAATEGRAAHEQALRVTSEAAFRQEFEGRLRSEASYVAVAEHRLRLDEEIADARAWRSDAQGRLVRLANEVEALRHRRVVRLSDLVARTGDLSGDVTPAFRRMLDDSRQFAGPLHGFSLGASESLRTSGPRTYPLRVDRPGLSSVSLAIAVDTRPGAGALEIALLSPAGETLRRAVLPAERLSEAEPARFEFEPFGRGIGAVRLVVSAHGLDVPVRLFEWRRSGLGAVARRSRAFCELGFALAAPGGAPREIGRVEDAEERRRHDRGKS
jgi:hypothetical protein